MKEERERGKKREEKRKKMFTIVKLLSLQSEEVTLGSFKIYVYI